MKEGVHAAFCFIFYGGVVLSYFNWGDNSGKYKYN